MRKLRFSRFLVIGVVTVSLVTSLIFFLSRDMRVRQSFSRHLSSASVTFSSMISYPLSSLKGFLSDFSSVDVLREENSQLQEKLAALEPYEEKIEDLISENEALKASLDLKENDSSQVLATGKVINRSTVAWLDWISLDIGEEQGLYEGMVVLSKGYLIGTVSQLSSFSSTVSLLTNTGSSSQIPVKITTESGDVYGILSGYDARKNAFLITKLNKKLEILKDSQVLTSGLDGKTVANVKVGQVLDVVSEDELNRTVYVSPGADFDQLSYVTVMGE